MAAGGAAEHILRRRSRLLVHDEPQIIRATPRMAILYFTTPRTEAPINIKGRRILRPDGR